MVETQVESINSQMSTESQILPVNSMKQLTQGMSVRISMFVEIALDQLQLGTRLALISVGQLRTIEGTMFQSMELCMELRI